VPELPDIAIYIEALERHIGGRRLERAQVLSPFVLRSVEVPPAELEGRDVRGIARLGKRIVLEFSEDRFMVIHLMIAGRLRWLLPGKKPPGRISLAVLAFATGRLVLTEAGTRRRASLHVLRNRAALEQFQRGGLEPLAAGRDAFAERLRSENHTLKRALTDPRLFSGIGNAYSDEILHRARLSPLTWTTRLDEEGVDRLYGAMREVLLEWVDRLREQTGTGFPEKVTAFRRGMAVHGRYREPCPVCGAPVQRIRYAENETNYCARCQTGGSRWRLLDRNASLSPGDVADLAQDAPRLLDLCTLGTQRGPSSGGDEILRRTLSLLTRVEEGVIPGETAGDQQSAGSGDRLDQIESPLGRGVHLECVKSVIVKGIANDGDELGAALVPSRNSPVSQEDGCLVAEPLNVGPSRGRESHEPAVG